MTDDTFEHLVGMTTDEAKQSTLGMDVRFIPNDGTSMLTMDYRPDRININYDVTTRTVTGYYYG